LAENLSEPITARGESPTFYDLPDILIEKDLFSFAAKKARMRTDLRAAS